MEQTPENKKWYQTLMTPQTVFYLVGAIVATVLFWYRTQESWVKMKELEERVSRQYQVQREMNDKTNNEIDDIKESIKYREGYEQARKDFNK